jgi:pantoate--beta-alanine ligase
VKTLNTIAQWRNFCDEQRRAGHRVGLIPTMGALHDGHAALIRAAVANDDVAVVTSFINPLQFSDARDLMEYPITTEEDEVIATAAGASALVLPSMAEMWPDFPNETSTSVHVAHLGDVLEGLGRPGHFDGVATVVAKLFAISGPCNAYFGEKDFQQVAVVQRLVRDMAWPVVLHRVATVRDADGLALSSRNRRLSADGRRRALSLSAALTTAASSTLTPSHRRAAMAEALQAAAVDVSYADIVDPATLLPVKDDFVGEARALVAGVVDGVRLIDNAPVALGGSHAVSH